MTESGVCILIPLRNVRKRWNGNNKNLMSFQQTHRELGWWQLRHMHTLALFRVSFVRCHRFIVISCLFVNNLGGFRVCFCSAHNISLDFPPKEMKSILSSFVKVERVQLWKKGNEDEAFHLWWNCKLDDKWKWKWNVWRMIPELNFSFKWNYKLKPGVKRWGNDEKMTL